MLSIKKAMKKTPKIEETKVMSLIAYLRLIATMTSQNVWCEKEKKPTFKSLQPVNTIAFWQVTSDGAFEVTLTAL